MSISGGNRYFWGVSTTEAADKILLKFGCVLLLCVIMGLSVLIYS